MVEPSTDICRLRHHGDIVRQIGHAQKACQNRSVLLDDPFTFAKPENIDQEVANSLALGGEQVEVVDTANWYAGGGRFCGRFRNSVSLPAGGVK